MTELKTKFFLSTRKYLVISLGVTFLIWLIPYLTGKNISIFTTDLFYIPLTMLLVMVSIYRVIYLHEKTARITWIIFLISSVAMLVAEHIWSFDELILGVKPFPSYADVAFLISYLLWIPFFGMFIKPLKNHISKKMIGLAICVSCSIIIPNVYMLFQSDRGIFTIENTLLSAYPIIDGVIFFPASIGFMSFFRGKTNFFPSLMFFAILPQLIADVLYNVTTANGTYYSGNIADLFYFIPFVMFMFGTYDLNKLEKKKEIGVNNT